MARAQDMSHEEVLDLLQAKLFSDLKKNATQLRADMMGKARCPTCTLVPPCQHFQSQQEIVTSASKIMGQKDFRDHVPAYKRDNTIKQLQKAATKNNFFTDKSM